MIRDPHRCRFRAREHGHAHIEDVRRLDMLHLDRRGGSIRAKGDDLFFGHAGQRLELLCLVPGDNARGDGRRDPP